MAVRSGFPILATNDLDRLVAFYASAFDAEKAFAFAEEDGADAYVTLNVGNAVVGAGREEIGTRRDERTALWFYVDDVDDSYERALAAGATSDSEPADMPWGERVARVRDPDGMLINLGSEQG